MVSFDTAKCGNVIPGMVKKKKVFATAFRKPSEKLSPGATLRLLIKKADSLNIRVPDSANTSDVVLLACMKRWINAYSPVGCKNTPQEYMESILENWSAICSGLLSQKHRYVWLKTPRVFDPAIFFKKPEFRKLIVTYHDTMHLLSSQQKKFESFFDPDKPIFSEAPKIHVDDAASAAFADSLFKI